MVPGPAIPALPGNLLEMQILGLKSSSQFPSFARRNGRDHMAIPEGLLLSYILIPAEPHFLFVSYMGHLLIILFKEKILLFKNYLKITSVGSSMFFTID